MKAASAFFLILGCLLLASTGDLRAQTAAESNGDTQATTQNAKEENDLPQVLLKTTRGDILIELFEDEAPNTVANFITLVEEGFYDGLPFHRVIDGFMAQGGCPKGDGTAGPGYAIECECYQENARKHDQPGRLAMAHAGKNTGGSQFYITFGPIKHLDGPRYYHTVFGQVIEGMEAVTKFTRTYDDRGPIRGAKADKIEKAEVVRKRDHEYKVKKLPDPRG